MSRSSYGLLADLVLIIHFSFVLFVVLGLILVWVGYFAGWSFVRNPWFRAAHLAAMAVVVAEAVIGMTCPLTTWEARLRVQAGEETYGGSFVQHWIHRMMFFEVAESTFTLIYIGVFGLLVLGMIVVRPRAFRAR